MRALIVFLVACAHVQVSPATAPSEALPDPLMHPRSTASGIITPTSYGPSGTGTSGRNARWTATAALGAGSVSDDGAGHVTIANTSGYAFTANPSGTDSDNRGFQCSSTWNGASGVGYCFHGLMTANSPTTAYAEKLGCINNGGGSCRALETSDGDDYFNTQNNGKSQFGGQVIFAPTNGANTVWFGLGSTSNVNLYEKHNTSPTLAGASCTGTGGTVTGSNWVSTVVVPSTATACDYTFASPAFTSAPSCFIQGVSGATATMGVAQTSKLPLTGLTGGQTLMIQCVGH